MNIRTMTPAEVRARFGVSHCRGFHTIVDERISRVRIIEKCIARGPVEWDAVNRMRAGGALLDYRLDGTTLIMDAVLETEKGSAGQNGGKDVGGAAGNPGYTGKGSEKGLGKELEKGSEIIHGRPLRFGPASAGTGGQALVSAALSRDGEAVKTRWKGIAGASVGVGACLGSAPGVERADYRDFTGIGGSHVVDVTLTTPALYRLVFGIDDTDSKEKGATWSLVMKMSKALEEAVDAIFLDLKVIQLCPLVPEKTTNCVSIALSVAVPHRRAVGAKAAARKFIEHHTLSDETGMAVLEGLVVPGEVVRYAEETKREVKSVGDALSVARENGIELFPVTGERGMIGALAAVGFFEKSRAAMLYSDYAVEGLERGD